MCCNYVHLYIHGAEMLAQLLSRLPLQNQTVQNALLVYAPTGDLFDPLTLIEEDSGLTQRDRAPSKPDSY